jgi:serine protease Do
MKNNSLWDDDDFNPKKPTLEDIKITPKNNENSNEQPNHGYIITEDKIEDEKPSIINEETEAEIEDVTNETTESTTETIVEEVKNEPTETEIVKTEGPTNEEPQDNNSNAVKPVFKKILFAACILVCIISVFTKFGPTKNNQTNTPPVTTPTTSQTEDLSNQKKEELGSDSIGNVIIENSGTQVLDVSKVVEKVLPAVVSISNLTTPHSPKFDGTIPDGVWYPENETASNASGVIIGDNGKEIWIVTNAHVIENARALLVTFNDGSKMVAYVKGSFEESDLAVISVKMSDLKDSTLKSIACINIGNSDKAKMGQSIITVGNALGYGQSATTGIISALNRKINVDSGYQLNTIQIDAAINPGNSGGALIDVNGNLIGIPTAKSSVTYAEGMGFAIPINDVKEKIEVLCAKEARMYATDDIAITMGINITDTYLGVMITDITQGSIAYDSQLQVGDIVTHVDGKEMKSSDKLVNTLRFYRHGETISLTVNRPDGKAYKTMEIKIKLGNQ